MGFIIMYSRLYPQNPRYAFAQYVTMHIKVQPFARSKRQMELGCAQLNAFNKTKSISICSINAGSKGFKEKNMEAYTFSIEL